MIAAPEPPIDSGLRGDIVCRRVGGVSTLTRLYSRSPLKLLSPSPVGDAACVVLSSFGGGMVAGDDVPIRVRVETDAACVLTTQASSKVYRSDGRVCRQSLSATVEDGAVLVVVPDPLCCFADARLAQRQRFGLSGSANLVWLDWLTSGRWARGERWAFESFDTRTDVLIDERPILRETLRLSDLACANAMRTGRFDTYAVLTIIGARCAEMIEHVTQVVGAQPIGRSMETLVSTARVQAGAIVRILGPRAQSVQTLLRQLLAPLQSVIGADPWARKW